MLESQFGEIINQNVIGPLHFSAKFGVNCVKSIFPPEYSINGLEQSVFVVLRLYCCICLNFVQKWMYWRGPWLFIYKWPECFKWGSEAGGRHLSLSESPGSLCAWGKALINGPLAVLSLACYSLEDSQQQPPGREHAHTYAARQFGEVHTEFIVNRMLWSALLLRKSVKEYSHCCSTGTDVMQQFKLSWIRTLNTAHPSFEPYVLLLFIS